LLTVRDLAAMLQVGTRTIYNLSAAGKLPAPLKIGGSVRWERVVIDTWLAGLRHSNS
jgi:excisionase family DNA binding protein